jgi:hypothetical protein
MPRPPLGPLSPEDIAELLAEHGYTANPAGLVPKYEPDFTFESESLASLDFNAIALRKKGDLVPDRPIRMTFRCEYNGALPQWRLISVTELPAGVPSKALDREPDFPKISPWPSGGVK